MIEMPKGGPFVVRDGTVLRLEVHPCTDPTSPRILVFCHGFGGSRRNFRASARELGDLCHTVLYDARGHGGAWGESPGERPVSFATLVDDLESMVAPLEGAELIVGGLSLGAATALAVACRGPERVRGLVLVSPPRGGSATQRFALALADVLGSAVELGGHLQSLAELGTMDAQEVRLVEHGLKEHDRARLAALLRSGVAQIPPLRQLPGFSSVTALPTLLVAGERDPNAIETAIELVGVLSRAQVEIIPLAGHVVNLTAPNEFNRALRRFVLQVWSTRSGQI